jgi:resolvase, N terminal domain
MNEQVVGRELTKRAIAFCCAMSGKDNEMQKQYESFSTYAKANEMAIGVTFRANARMESFTYRSLRLRAKYREFDVLLVPELDALGNSPIEITHEINFLTENGIKVISLKDGELNAETLPLLFRKMFRLVEHNS